MKIAIVVGIEFTHKIKEIANKLLEKGHKVEIPFTAKKIMKGEISLEEFKKIKKKEGDIIFRNKSGEDLIKRYFQIINNSDAILVLNFDKNNIKNYIGGNALIEMAFAYVLEKEIYLLNLIPKINYSDEIIAMQPIIINGDLSKIK
jgi:hypothetical protein